MRPELHSAIRAAAMARDLADTRSGADQLQSKGGIDLVTGADIACEDAIRALLGAAHPAIGIVGEERGGTPAPGAPYWLVDPICGTRPYASNVPLYCTNVALVEDGRVSLAAVAIGGSDEVLYAQRGSGTWLRTASGDRPAAASARSDTVWVNARGEHGASVLRELVLRRRWYVWMFSSSLAFAQLAAGRIAGIVGFAIPGPPVHTAAGCLLAEEAGAVVTDLHGGGPWTVDSCAYLIGATRALHDELRALIEQHR
jgi:myo-inositol-1(or 4)-monophosphatase